MTFHRRRIAFSIATLALLAGCAGSGPGGGGTVFTVPVATPDPYAPPVSESYVIQRAPVATPYYAPYAPAELYDAEASEIARQEAEARRMELDALQRRVEIQRIEEVRATPVFGVLSVQDTSAGNEAQAQAEARAEAAEAEAASLAAELAEARRAVADAEAAVREAESAAQRSVRSRVAELAAERNAPRDRANPARPARPVLGGFVTRPASPVPEERADATLRPATPPAITPPPPARSAPPAQPIVTRAPIPGLKPYILARSAIPSAKPRRALPDRAFDIGMPSALSVPGAAPTAPTGPAIPREPGDALSTRFFPTPGKPSTMGTDRDAALDLASIDAVPYGVGAQVRAAVDSDSATAEWADAVRLIENGEVEALAIMEDSDLALTLCSGRSILTTPPDLAAAATLTAPQIICGQNKPLELR